jgi:hypothetical protein
MSKPAEKNQKPKLDLDPTAWEKFEALIKNAAKMGHKPHKGKGDGASRRLPVSGQGRNDRSDSK